MNIFFDMDYTILSMDNTLRPGTKDVFQSLLRDGHTLYIWSGQGIRWREVEEHGLRDLVADCFEKPLERYAEKLRAQALDVWPDLVVDDYPEVPNALGGIWVKPYFFRNDGDVEMELVYRLITTYAREGRCDHHQFRLPGSKSLL